MLTPSLNLFLAAVIIGLGFGLGYPLMAWLVGKLTALADR